MDMLLPRAGVYDHIIEPRHCSGPVQASQAGGDEPLEERGEGIQAIGSSVPFELFSQERERRLVLVLLGDFDLMVGRPQVFQCQFFYSGRLANRIEVIERMANCKSIIFSSSTNCFSFLGKFPYTRGWGLVMPLGTVQPADAVRIYSCGISSLTTSISWAKKTAMGDGSSQTISA